MSAINQASSQFDSFYDTPIKYHHHHLNTNASSLSYSQTLFTSKFRNSDELKQGWRSNQFLKDYPALETMTLRQEDRESNSCDMTLNPVITQQELQDVLKYGQMIEFLAEQSREQKILIKRKQLFLSKVSQQLIFLQQKLASQKRKYSKLQSKVNALRKKTQIQQRKKSVAIERDFSLIKTEIKRMRRTLSNKKIKITEHNQYETDRKNKFRTEFKRKDNKTHRKKIIYIPIAYDCNYAPNFISNQQYSPYHNFFPEQQFMTESQTRPCQPPLHHLQHQQQADFRNNNHFPHHQHSNPQNSFFPPPKHSSKHSTEQQKKSKNSNPFDLLSQKMRRDSLPNNEKNRQNSGIITGQDLAAVDQSNQQNRPDNYNIHVLQPFLQPNSQNEPCLDYLNESKVRQIEAEEIELIKKKKNQTSLLDVEEPSEGEEEVRKTLEMIQQSQKKIKLEVPSDKSANNKQQRSEIGAKLVQTQFQDDFDGFQLQERSRSKEKSNASDINISIESEDKKNSRFSDSSDKKNNRQCSPAKKENIAQSSINIIIQSLTAQKRKEENPVITKLLPKKDFSKLQKQIAAIEEVDEDIISRQNTPIDSQVLNSFQLAVESKLSKSQKRAKQTKQLEHPTSNSMSSNNKPRQKSNFISKPPSLQLSQNNGKETTPGDEQQEQFNDFLGNIQLSPESKVLSRDNFSSIKKSAISPASKVQKKLPADQEDDLFEISLATESRISRDRKSTLKVSQNSLPEEEPQMAQSEPKKFNRTSLEEQVQDNLEQEEMIRNSTVSSIVRKGSAINKVKNRAAVNDIKVSNYGSPRDKRRSFQSVPIIEEQEQEDKQSTIVNKGRKFTSSIK